MTPIVWPTSRSASTPENCAKGQPIAPCKSLPLPSRYASEVGAGAEGYGLKMI